MRHIVRCALLAEFAEGRHGTFEAISAGISVPRSYHPNSLKVQVSQVRRELLHECKINIGPVRGRLTNAQKAEIERQLGLVPVKKRIAKLQAAARKVYRSAA
jgi:hypothetical protein